jgi:hypothetical protein
VAILFLAYGIGVAAQIWRYNHEPQAVKKQQIKWFLYGLLSALLGFAVYYLVLILFPILRAPGMPGLLYLLFGLPVLHISVLMVPLSLAIAISRFHLWDVDLLINRSLVYTALTTFILAFYGLAVIAFEQLFRWVWGWDRSPVAIAISTLLIAYLIGPLRNLIQQRVNKRFYRRRFDADLAITRLSLKLRDEVDIQKLAEALLNTVDETMQPEQVSLWLRKQD